MNASNSWKLLVFRDGKRVCSGPSLLQNILLQLNYFDQLADINSVPARDSVVEALLRAGELECAVEDDAPENERDATLAGVTDELALALIENRKTAVQSSLRRKLESLAVPSHLSLSTPEGFCYYALHPLDYAKVLTEAGMTPACAAVVGIRSIGTTLSAVVSAWFHSRRITSSRITVRPEGHPFDRTLDFSAVQQHWIAANLRRKATFFVVDEGPGLSGSSFLATAEALARHGVPERSIFLLPSSVPNLGKLFAPNAAARWSRFQMLPPKSAELRPSDAAVFIGAGEWRKHVFRFPEQWPPVWPWTERQKYLSADGRLLYRFDGLGHYGNEVRARTQLLHDHGWGPEAVSAGDGFTRSPWLTGSMPEPPEPWMLRELASYCAFRVMHFPAPHAATAGLEEMTRINLHRAVHHFAPDFRLPLERPVIADGRMMPFAWRINGRRLQKTDAAAHGDDHFYPGPTDIAWDLAGAIVEWNLNPEASAAFSCEYTRQSGDDPEPRLHAYQVAYCAFRMAFALSAAQSADAHEKSRFAHSARRYTEKLNMLLAKIPPAQIGIAASHAVSNAPASSLPGD